MCVFISKQPAGEWQPWNTSEPFRAAGMEGLLPGSIPAVAEPAAARGPCGGKTPAPATFLGAVQEKGEDAFWDSH